MIAVLESSGRQFKVRKGDEIEVDRIRAEEGSRVQFDRILLVAEGEKIAVGKPYLENAKVTGELLSQEKGEKVISFRMKRRKGYRRKVGSRRKYSLVRIDEIQAGMK